MKKRLWRGIYFLIMLIGILTMVKQEVQASAASAREMADTYEGIVQTSPDGQAWTIPGQRGSAERLTVGTRIDTGIGRSIREPEEWEHIYIEIKNGTVNVGYWQVGWYDAKCVHGGIYEGKERYGIIGGPICYARFDNGWYAYCADCGNRVFPHFVYGTQEVLRQVTSMPGVSNYFFVCPESDAIEQGVGYSHQCIAISANRYTVQYEANVPEDSIPLGVNKMDDTHHMYNNEALYNGKAATYKDKALAKNQYACRGYRFVGWNTQADGSGTRYSDGQEIFNLTTENNGTVLLYAMWEKIESVLQLDACGGNYAGDAVHNITGAYGTEYELLSSLVVPPKGYLISFEANGGSACDTMITEKTFSYWQPVEKLKGLLEGNRYTFKSTDSGSVDVIRIMYQNEPVSLPAPVKENYSFGGWYYDAGFELPAGGPGDSFSCTEDITLYAQWVELVLVSEDNYTDNDKKGAVNLSWSQPDTTAKVYKLYQSVDAKEWNKLNDLADTGDARSVTEHFTYVGEENTYTVPYSGLYTLTAAGAQTGDCNAASGDVSSGNGLGGLVSGVFWLNKDDVLTYCVGGQDGFPDRMTEDAADNATGNAGGSSSITSREQGLLLLAEGGGADGIDSVTGKPLTISDISFSVSHIKKLESGNYNKCGYRKQKHGSYLFTMDTGEGDSGNNSFSIMAKYNGSTRIHTNGCRYLEVQTGYSGWGEGNLWRKLYGYKDGVPTRLTVGKKIDISGYDYISFSAGSGFSISENQNKSAILSVTKFEFSGETTSSTTIHVNNNYVETALAHDFSMRDNVQRGNGYIEVQSEDISFYDEMTANAVPAPDLAPPDRIQTEGVMKETGEAAVSFIAMEGNDGSSVKVVWTQPRDNGTDYYHKVESYLIPGCRRVSVSNITKNTLISGVKGYYYLVNSEKKAIVTEENGSFTDGGGDSAVVSPGVEIPLTDTKQYLHIAAVDMAGNLGETSTIEIGASDPDTELEEFALTATVERILEPHLPVFKSGESGVLRITVTGYAHKLKIDFPDLLDAYDCEIVYTDARYVQEETVEFMIPLYEEESENYTITVIAFKGESILEEFPGLAILGTEGSVLDELRTRLR